MYYFIKPKDPENRLEADLVNEKVEINEKDFKKIPFSEEENFNIIIWLLSHNNKEWNEIADILDKEKISISKTTKDPEEMIEFIQHIKNILNSKNK